MIRPVYFIWLVVPTALYLIFQLWGLPHMALSYRFRDDGQGSDPFAYRWYLSCTYYGVYGPRKAYADNGKCPWFRFYKKQEPTNAK